MWFVNDCVMCNVNDCVRMMSRWIWLSYNFVSISADRLIRILLKIDIIDFINCKNTKVHVNDVIHEYMRLVARKPVFGVSNKVNF